MKIPRFLLSAIVALAALVAVQFALTQMASADAPRQRQMFVIVADGASLRDSEESAYLTRSLMGLIATLKPDHQFVVIRVEDPSDILGPYGAREFDARGVQYEFLGRIMSTETNEGGRFSYALAEAHAVLGAERAAVGSAIYVIAGSSPETDFDRQYRRSIPLLTRFKERGWHIDGISLPGAPGQATEFLSKIAFSSGGQVFELSVSDGLKQLTDSILSRGARGSLTPAGRRVLKRNEVMTSFVNIAPGTRETTLLFFKESPFGYLRLSNPDGFDVSAGDRTSSYVVETPHVVAWRITDPAPGRWRVDARGMEGLTAAWEHSINKYSIVFNTVAPVPLNEATTISAYVTDGDQVLALQGVRLFASVTTPDGGTLVHELKDDGTHRDAEAGDGYFTATLSPLRTSGDHEVELELSWAEVDYQLFSRTSFTAQAFPTVEVKPVQPDGLVPGERTKVATVYVHVQGEPYAVDAGQLTASTGDAIEKELQAALVRAQPEPVGDTETILPPPILTSDTEPMLELEPRRLFGDGPAWEFDVYFTAQDEGVETVVFELNLEYAGTEYSHTSRSIVVTAASPIVVVEQVEKVVRAAPVAASPAPQPLSAVPFQSEPSGFPWVLMLVLGLIVAGGLGAAAVYLLTQGRPYGYLYNDLDEPLVDFSKVERHPLVSFFLRGSIRGSELNVPELAGVVFQFSKSRIRLRSLGDHPTIRVNNQPLVKQAPVRDRTWIGTGGKLFTFLRSPVPAPGSAGAD